MKRAAAIILILTLIWLQMVAGAQTTPSATPVQCGCCTTKQSCCCIEQSAPETIPLPIAPAPASAAIDFTAVIPKQLAWMLPASSPAIVSSTDSSASSLAVSLFQRDCALLI